MFTKLLVAALFGFAFAGAPALQAQTQSSAPTPQDAVLKPVPSDNPAPSADAKASNRHKQVYTNDNLPKANPGDFSGADFSEINNCDRNCFEQVRQLAHAFPGSNPNWKRDLLRALDTVRKDADWQKYLRDLYDVHQRFCALGAEKRDELAYVADPANVTRVKSPSKTNTTPSSSRRNLPWNRFPRDSTDCSNSLERVPFRCSFRNCRSAASRTPRAARGVIPTQHHRKAVILNPWPSAPIILAA